MSKPADKSEAPILEISTASNQPSNDVHPPRQPKNMQGLLKFAMEATKLDTTVKESQFKPLDEDRKRFLQQALHSMTIDVIEILQNNLKILENIETIKNDGDFSEHINALERISEYVCDIDTANDFHKIGGFVVLQPCLKCSNAEIRAQTCNLLAELSQNNPYCQRVVLGNGFMPVLLNIVETDPDPKVIAKSIYAISCNVRENAVGCAQLIQFKGVQIFMETLKRLDEKSNIKICFLLDALCSSQPDFKSRLVFQGYIPVLFNLLLQEVDHSHEHVLALLHTIFENNPAANQECKQNYPNGKEILERYIAKNKEEFPSEVEYCNTIYKMLNK